MKGGLGDILLAQGARYPELMPLRREPGHNFHVDQHGREWCSAGMVYHKVAKRRYETIDDAWRAAFVEFVRTGEPLTPYFCTAIRRRVTTCTCIPHPNPWAFRAWYLRVNWMDLKRRRSCGGWHLTRRHYQCLPHVAPAVIDLGRAMSD
jgi:hypothetical protein